MFRFDEGLKVYLHRAPVDFRLSINGLAVQWNRPLAWTRSPRARTYSATAGATA